MGKKRKSKTPKVMQDNIAVGIGGSFLGPLQTIQRLSKQQGEGNCIYPEAIETARGRQLHFGIVLEGGMHSSVKDM
ncbi:unnamed protein product [Prunus armeniaca]